MKDVRVTGLLAAWLLAALSSCANTGPDPKCVPQAVLACQCTSHSFGVDTCGADGQWSGCVCDPHDGGTASSGTTGGTNAGHGGGGSDASVGKSGAGGSSGAGGAAGASGSNASDDAGHVLPTNDAAVPPPSTDPYSGPCIDNTQCPAMQTCSKVSSGLTTTLSYCGKSCMANGDCPAPKTGTAIPSCVGVNILTSTPGNCSLPCGGLSVATCPTGTMCSGGLFGGQCAWMN